jgi:hypothetical protein
MGVVNNNQLKKIGAWNLTLPQPVRLVPIERVLDEIVELIAEPVQRRD